MAEVTSVRLSKGVGLKPSNVCLRVVCAVRFLRGKGVLMSGVRLTFGWCGVCVVG